MENVKRGKFRLKIRHLLLGAALSIRPLKTFCGHAPVEDECNKQVGRTCC